MQIFFYKEILKFFLLKITKQIIIMYTHAYYAGN